MALGAVTPQVDNPVGSTSPDVEGNLRVAVINVVGDSSYATGGSALPASAFGLNTVLFGQAEAIATTGANNGSSAAYYNPATAKLQCFTTGATGALNEVAAAANLSGITWQIIVWGY